MDITVGKIVGKNGRSRMKYNIAEEEKKGII